jgi:hypothetical protein
MKTGDITLVFKTALDLALNTGLIMEAEQQSIAIIKRQDKYGLYYSINDTIDNVPQKQYHDTCLMTLLLLNQNRFKYSMYKSKISKFK